MARSAIRKGGQENTRPRIIEPVCSLDCWRIREEDKNRRWTHRRQREGNENLRNIQDRPTTQLCAYCQTMRTEAGRRMKEYVPWEEETKEQDILESLLGGTMAVGASLARLIPPGISKGRREVLEAAIQEFKAIQGKNAQQAREYWEMTAVQALTTIE